MYPIAQYLAEQIGPRPAGSPAELQAARYIQERFADLGLTAQLQPFRFLNWTPLAPPVLEVLEPVAMRIPAAPMAFTLPTPPAGVVGEVRKIGVTLLQFGNIQRQKYVLVDEAGEELGYFLKGGNEEASTFPAGNPFLQAPGAIIGSRDAALVEEWLAAGRRVRLRLINRAVQEMGFSQNVIARIGTGAPRLILCAHYDGVYDSPAAVDNGSGVQVLFNLLERLRPRFAALPPLAVVAFGCEELKFNGANHYATYLQEHDQLADIRYLVNLDMVAAGTEITVSTGNGMAAFTDPLIAAYQPQFTSRLVPGEVKPTSDHWPFHEKGVATVQLTALPYGLYHQASDRMANFQAGLLAEVETFAAALLERLLEAL